MDNYAIAENFSLLSKLMDIHGDNSFKARIYGAAAFNIEKLPNQLADTPAEKIASIKGIGDSTAKKIAEMLETGVSAPPPECRRRYPRSRSAAAVAGPGPWP